MKKATNRMIADALFARLTTDEGRMTPPEKVTGEDLNDAYEAARQAVGNPLPLVSIRCRTDGPKSVKLSESRRDEVLAIYAELVSTRSSNRS